MSSSAAPASSSAAMPPGCPPGERTLFGDQQIDTLVEYQALKQGCFTHVEGDFIIASALDIVEIDLPLVEVRGRLAVESNANLATVVLDALRVVKGDDLDIVNNASLTSLSLASLEEVDVLNAPYPEADLRIRNNPGLTQVVLPSLRRVEAILDVSNNALLQRLQLPLAESADTLKVEDNPRLTELQLTSFASATWAHVRNNPMLASLSLPALTFVRWGFEIHHNQVLHTVSAPIMGHGTLTIGSNPVFQTLGLTNAFAGGIDIQNSPAVTQLHLGGITRMDTLRLAWNDALVGVQGAALTELSKLEVYGNPILEQLSLPSLSTCDFSFKVYNNVMLPACHVDALRAQVQDSFDFYTSVRADGNAPECPGEGGDACGGVTYHGRCNGNVAEWCEAGALQSQDCSENGTTCQWVNDTVGWWCM